MFKKVYSSFILFIAIFGPKFGIFDTRLFLAFFIYLLYPGDLKNLPKTIVFLFICLFFLTGYSLLVYIFNESDYVDSLRYLRCIFGTFLVVHLFKNFDFKLIFNTLIFVLLLHIISIYTSVLFPQSQAFFAYISGYNKDFRPFRVSGLVAGFDIAGILSLITSYLLYELVNIEKKKIFYILFFLSYFSVFFTSRTNSLYAILLAFYFFYKFMKGFKLKPTFIFSLLTFSFSFIFILYRFVLPILIDSWNLDIAIEFAERPDIYESGYSKNNPLEILESLIIIPNNFIGLIFGTSFDPPDSDSGYIKSLNIIGLFGLCFYFLTFFTIYFSLTNKKV